MLELQRFLVKEQVALLRRASTYEIIDPDTRRRVGVAREQLGATVKMLRWLLGKRATPVYIEVRETEDESLLCSIRRPVQLWGERVDVYDADDRLMGTFRSKWTPGGRGFWLYDDQNLLFAELKGDVIGWDFGFFTPDGRELGTVRKSWAGLGRELFTSADNYVISVHEDLEDQPIAKMLLLASALAVDLVYFSGMT